MLGYIVTGFHPFGKYFLPSTITDGKNQNPCKQKDPAYSDQEYAGKGG